MSRRPGSPGHGPAPNGHPGPDRPAAPLAAAPDDDRLRALQAALALRWAVILRHFRDYMHHK
jgi:hypothetical protein